MNKLRFIIILLLFNHTCYSQFSIRQIDSIIADIEHKNLMLTEIGDTTPVYICYPGPKYMTFYVCTTEFYYSENKLLKAILRGSIVHCTIDGKFFTDTIKIDPDEDVYYFNDDSLICIFRKEPNSYPATFQYFYFKGNELKFFEEFKDYQSKQYRLVKSSLQAGRDRVDRFYNLKKNNKLNQ